MPTRRPADAENPPLTDGFGRSIFPEILSARNTGSLAIWFRHHCFVERGARELPLSPHSGNHRQLTTPHGRMQALCKTHVKLPPPRHFHRRICSETRAVLMHRPQGKQESSTARLYSAYYTLIAGRLSDVLGVLEAMPHTLPHNT